MRYYLDTEFNGPNGVLISLGVIREDGYPLYLVNKDIMHNTEILDPWIVKNVYSKLLNGVVEAIVVPLDEFHKHLYQYLFLDHTVLEFIVDWPDDLKYLSDCMITSPGKMIDIDRFKLKVIRVDSYPNDLGYLLQHNAIDDAIALRYKLLKRKDINHVGLVPNWFKRKLNTLLSIFQFKA